MRKQTNTFTMELLNKVRDYLKKEKRYDFADEKWTGEMLGIVYDAVYATEAVMSEPKSSQWISVEDKLPEFGETVLVYCKIYGRYLATYEYIGDFQGEKYGNWRDFNGNLGILPPIYWLEIPEIPSTTTVNNTPK